MTVTLNERSSHATAGCSGRVSRVIGPVVDIEFPHGRLPGLLHAVLVDKESGPIVVEVEQHLGEDRVTAGLGARGVGDGDRLRTVRRQRADLVGVGRRPADGRG